MDWGRCWRWTLLYAMLVMPATKVHANQPHLGVGWIVVDTICIRQEESRSDQSCTCISWPRSWVRFGFRGWRRWKGPSASAVFTIGGRVVDEWWEGSGFFGRRPLLSGTQRGSLGTARAPGLVSTSITTRLGLSWNAGDLVESSAHRC